MSLISAGSISLDSTLNWNIGIVHHQSSPIFEKSVKIGSPCEIFSNNVNCPCDVWSVGKEPTAMFEFTTWRASFLDFLISLRHYTVIGKQLFISNDRNRVRWVVLGLSQDRAWTDLAENLSENNLKGDLSNTATFNPPFFSLVNTFNTMKLIGLHLFFTADVIAEKPQICVNIYKF